jgi:protein TonB
MSGNGAEQTPLVAAATAAVWIACALVGVVGLLLPYERAHPPTVPPRPPTQVVELLPPQGESKEMTERQVTPQENVVPPPPPDVMTPPAAPPLAAAAPPSPEIEFAKPVNGPTKLTDAAHAAPAAAPSTAPAALAVQHLTFGVGEGQQPDPEYPPEAVAAGEEGTVVVRFTVGEDGRVESAEASQPCRWPVLNRTAVRTVRDDWRFGPGNVRAYDVPIEFRINQQ